MKNKKLLKALATVTMAAAMATTVAFTACKSDSKEPPSPPSTEQGSETPSVTQYTVTFDLNYDTATKTHSVKVDENAKVTAPSGITERAGYIFDGWYTQASGGDEVDLSVYTVSGDVTVYAHWTPNAVIPAYTGPAPAVTAGTVEVDEHFKAETLPTGVLASDWSDGVITIPAGTNIRSRKDSSNTGTKSVQNGKITIKMPAEGTIKIIYASGSGTIGNASYKLTSPDGAGGTTSSTETINAADKATQTLIITAQAGTYVFEKAGGTVDVWEIDYAYSTENSAIQSIEITDKGTTDYLVTQTLDCSNLKIIAKDANNVAHDVSLSNCKFDTTAYKPDISGKYQISVTYYLAGNLDGGKTEFTATYEVKVYAVDSVSLVTVGLESGKQVTVQQAYLPNDTFKKDYLTVIGNCKCGEETVDFKLKNEWLDITAPDLTTEGEKQVGISVDTDYTVGNKAVTSSYKVMVKNKKDVEENKVEITVGETGDFKTLTQAAQYLKACNYASDVNKVIKVQAGTYTEKVWLDVDNVTLIGLGENIDDTEISYSLVEGDVDKLSGSVWALNCATLHVTGKNFKAYHIAIRNDFDYIANNKNYSGSQAAQGVALTLDNKDGGFVIYDCHLYGNQDTLYMKSGRSYYYKTQIDGNIDFIFGGETSVAYFEECKIVAIDREQKDPASNTNPQNGYVTAPQHKEGTKPTYGYVFYKCELTDDGEVDPGAMSLGRPWGPKATVSYIECKFSAAYSQTGTDSGKKINRWNDWDSSTTAANADYSEYGSADLEGNPIMSAAVQGGKVLSQGEAANYTKENTFGAGNTSSYTLAWDYESAFATLKILADLEKGELPQDKTVTVNLKDENIPDGNCAAYLNETYAAQFTWTGFAKFQNSVDHNPNTWKPENGVQVDKTTVISLNIVGEVSLVAGYQLPVNDYIITYKDGKATIKFVAITGTYGDYIGSIVIDTSKTDIPDTQTVDITLDYNDEGATPQGTVQAVVGAPLPRPADPPARTGYKFAGWQKDGVDYAFEENVTEAFTLTAKWESVGDFDFTNDVTVDFLTEFRNQKVEGSTLVWRGITIDATSGKFTWRDGNPDIQVNANTTLSFTIASGKMLKDINIAIRYYDDSKDLVKDSDYELSIDGSTVTVTFKTATYIRSLALTYNN